MLIEHSNKSSHNTQVYLLNLEFEQKLEYCSQSHSSRGLNQNFLLQGRVVTSTLTRKLIPYPGHLVLQKCYTKYSHVAISMTCKKRYLSAINKFQWCERNPTNIRRQDVVSCKAQLWPLVCLYHIQNAPKTTGRSAWHLLASFKARMCK